MESLEHLLAGRGAPKEPPEIRVIKNYVQETYHQSVEVMVREKDIVIVAANASLINTLRLRGPAIKKLCATSKRITFRNG